MYLQSKSVKKLVKSWYQNSLINNLDIQELVRTAVAYPDISLAYISNSQ